MHPLLTGSIAPSAKRRLFNLLRGRFSGFSPRRGDTLQNLARPLFRAKFHTHRCKDEGTGPPKLKFLLIFDQNVEQGRIPCTIFTKFAVFVHRLRMR